MKTILTIAVATIVLAGSAEAAPHRANPEAKLHRFSTTVEKERPQLNEETKRLIAPPAAAIPARPTGPR